MMKVWILTFFLAALLFLNSSPVDAAREIQVHSYKIHDAQEFIGNPHLNNTYFYKTVSFPYKSGRVFMSGNPEGTAPISFSHSNSIYATYPSNGFFTYYPGCGQNTMQPLDVTQFLNLATAPESVANITIKYQNQFCSLSQKIDGQIVQIASVGPAYLVYFEEIDTAPDPFLRLPWDYEKYGLNFYDVSTKINSFFDHEYPLLSALHIVQEPYESSHSIVMFDGLNTKKEAYTSHDGYDWGGSAKALNGEPVLAAADGVATYVSTCRQCGNAIHIDHGNGYQTRYYHLQKTGLITNNSIQVQQGDQIGLIGSTGNSNGPHIHFMVIHDKNGDGNFADNIPDGVVDPFGWHSYDTDPWEAFTFSQNGEERSGSQSHYLWMKPYQKLQTSVGPDGASLHLQRYKLNLPQGFLDSYVIVEANLQPSKANNSTDQFGSALEIKIHDGFGNLITSFQKAWNLIINFSGLDYTRIKPDTLSIYSKSDGEDDWQKEESIIDLETNTASAQIDHLSEFVLMGKKIDSIPPTTTATISGKLLQDRTYSSEQELNISLSADDEPVEDSLGIKFILYKINENDWTEYLEEPIVLTNLGQYTIKFYAQDNDLNTEEVQELSFTIATSPTPTPTSTPRPTITPIPAPTIGISSTPTPKKGRVLGKKAQYYWGRYFQKYMRHHYHVWLRSIYRYAWWR